MKKILLIIMLLLLTGCSDYRELSDMAMVSNIAIDKELDKFKIIVQVLDSTKKNDDNESPSVILYDSTGLTLHEAFRNITLESPKKLYIGHVDTIIIGESLAKDGINNFIDFILRDAEMEKDFNLIITTDPINEVMNVLTPLISIPSLNISSSIKISKELKGNVVDISFDEFVSNTLIEGIDPVLPILYIKKMDSKNEDINPENRLVLSKNTAIFNKYKLINYLSEDASLGLNLINNNTTSSVITFKCDNESYASIELLTSKSKFKYDYKNNKINININLTGTLSELNCNMDTKDIKIVKDLEKQAENRIKEILDNTIIALKENNSDFIGIGKYLYQNNYKYYKSNKENIPNLIKNINSEYDVTFSFTQKTSLKKGDEK